MHAEYVDSIDLDTKEIGNILYLYFFFYINFAKSKIKISRSRELQRHFVNGTIITNDSHCW